MAWIQYRKTARSWRVARPAMARVAVVKRNGCIRFNTAATREFNIFLRVGRFVDLYFDPDTKQIGMGDGKAFRLSRSGSGGPANCVVSCMRFLRDFDIAHETRYLMSQETTAEGACLLVLTPRSTEAD